MRVLVMTRAPWRNDNNTGNTMTNFFSEMNDIEFYNLYFRDQLPQNDIAKKSFAISEGQLIKNLLKKASVGREICEQDVISSDKEEGIYNLAKKYGTVILAWLRELLWSVDRWKSNNLKKFLDEIKPDVVFMSVFNCYYPHKVLQFVKKQTGAKVILFHVDDNYTLRQFSLSPLYWLYRFNLRKWVRKSVSISDINYVISNIQKTEYEKAFKKECKILTKFADFSGDAPIKTEYNRPLQLVFTGNIGTNRWKTLALIAEALEEINKNELKAQLNVYTATPLTKGMLEKLNLGDSSIIKGRVDASEIHRIQMDADILVHVEGFDLKNRCLLHQSFSTKIVDYCKEARPIFAVAPHDVASIDELRRNNGAMIATKKKEIKPKLEQLINRKETLDEYSKKSFLCGRNNYSNEKMKDMLYKDLNNIK